MLRERFEQITLAVRDAALAYYQERLVSLAVFGSVARGTPRPDSDIDLLVVAYELPVGRLKRVREFDRVEGALSGILKAAEAAGIYTIPAPVIKTPAEVEYGSPLFLDMTDCVMVLYDKDGFFKGYLQGLRRRLQAMGAKRVHKGGGYYWVLKPDYQPGDEIVL